jgi:methionyl-tRNA formyltransferase
LKSPDFIDELRSLNANLGIVVAFRMLPEIVWSMPEFGTFNLHASLLPDYRGAAPINHAIINGETETGVTTFFLQHEIDTGHIIFQEKTAIYPGETAGELHDRLMNAGANLVVKTAKAIENDNYPQISQCTFRVIDNIIKQAPKIFKEDCRIRWNETPERIYNLIRGLSPYPAAFGYFLNTSDEQILVKIFKANFENVKHNHHPGEIEIVGKDELFVWVRGGKIRIHELQLEGKKRMQTKDFLNGFHLTENWKII